jgi:hypothetical protein
MLARHSRPSGRDYSAEASPAWRVAASYRVRPNRSGRPLWSFEGSKGDS